ncbi:DUF4870 domain-containing protein [Gracilibacillus thailandensis]|uniref:DUF4870 domain-containing protein n=1 Tax=Gracilibacillus thailandensis TaxID=563735 RepID=A0A6N7R1S1_9BACI|nr:DUF4870 domain-containing protein [Gracilibacillus thailandensis]MRI66399.1 DUF4870 domain-containing protein [Gracilibacillus thailandensis]
MTNSDERLFGMLIYLLSFFAPIIGPLIIWLIKRDESAFIDYHGKEYFNFFISFTIYSIVSGILVVVLIGFVLLAIVAVLAFIFTLIALFKAFNGEEYRIPLVIRFIK